MCNKIVLVLVVVAIGKCHIHNKFPENFKFGVASSAYQIEGGWNANGKGENIWDHFTHNFPNSTADRTNGDIACDSYHLWKNDIALLKYLNVSFYRFSISWSRILPTGFTNTINLDGVRYYNNIIDELIRNKIEPMVTLYHWDLPQPIQDIGGMTNPLIADYFVDYATTAFYFFGDRVKTWITFNEPIKICLQGYENGLYAPGIKSRGIGCYLCSKTLLLAHANTYHVYKSYFKSVQHGKVGIAIDSDWYEPKTNSKEDEKSVERVLQMNFGWWINPIFSKGGNYPRIMRERIDKFSKTQNFSISRLPVLTSSEIRTIKGTYDFLGLNHYSSKLVKARTSLLSRMPSFDNDVRVDIETDPNWEKSALELMPVVPWGLRKLLNWIRKMYNNPTVYITENGYPDKGGLDDEDRISYHTQYLNELINAIRDGCNVQRYTIWSLMDSMEWTSGYKIKFGLYHVDFSDENRPRTPKKSASFYKNVIRDHGVPNIKRNIN
ncbi:myrosinase 1-like [Agrilus planipennis]|uniref:Myrosinase 1-like n=1 Tax=Agrilus planipennis TaxID=224129 RepID=A0A7F5QV02_AGRPL|nr:myrosinase 1-like [Agrilus planipennis]